MITGAVPLSIADLSSLQMLTLVDNDLEELPDLSGLSVLSELRVQNNRFTFEDLEPNVSIPTFEYAPQASFGTPVVFEGVEGQTLSVAMTTGGEHNAYRWFLNGVEIPGATSATYMASPASVDDSGDYVLHVTNAVVPGLTLESAVYTANIVAAVVDVTEPQEVEPTPGVDVQVEAELSAVFNPTSREICFRRTGEPTYACSALSGGGAFNSGSIPGEYITERGVEYYYRFSSGDLVITTPSANTDTDPFRLRVPVEQYVVPITFKPRRYYMFSIPLELQDPDVASVIPGVGSSDQIRLLRWSPTAGRYIESPELPDRFTEGTAFWFISAQSVALSIEKGMSVDASEPYRISLLPGWSQIGNPFAFPLAWSDVLNADLVEAPVAFDVSFDGDNPYRYNQDLLVPWAGYWVYNPLASTVVIQVPPIGTNGSGKYDGHTTLPDEAIYILQLEAFWAGRRLRDSQNFLGLAETATDGYDPIDFAEAPGIGEHLRLSIIEGTTRMAGSFKAAGAVGHEWLVEIAAESAHAISNSEEEISVRLHETGVPPSASSLLVVDEDGVRIPIIESAFSVRVTDKNRVQRIRIIVGSKDFAADLTDGRALVPQTFALNQNYPNPFNPKTHIRYQLSKGGHVYLSVFNTLGQQVAVLVDLTQEPGWYDAIWEGRDDAGRRVSSGLYLYRMQFEELRLTRPMVLLK
jgi:hypothetical protein